MIEIFAAIIAFILVALFVKIFHIANNEGVLFERQDAEKPNKEKPNKPNK